MKELFTDPEIRVIVFAGDDIIMTSEETTGNEGIELPDLPIKP